MSLELYTGDALNWNKALARFPDYTLYQTYEWGEHKKNGGWKVIRLFLKIDDQIIYMLQALVKTPFPSLSIVWIPGGISGDLSALNPKEILPHLVSGMSMMRVSFNFSPPNGEEVLTKKGWKKATRPLNSGKSLFLYPNQSEEELRSNLSKNWRHNLNRSQKKGIVIDPWYDPEPHQIYELYRVFEKMKGIPTQYTRDDLISLFSSLSGFIRLFTAKDSGGEFLGLRGYAFMEDRAWDLFAITSDLGRKNYASQALLWHMLLSMKDQGITQFDFSGVDPDNNPGVYNFKKGTGAEDIEFLGEWDFCSPGLLHPFFNALIQWKFKN